nr:60S ribosomal protein L10a-2-like [Rhipicephalus microplus]
MLFNGMASVVDCAAQTPSRRLESVELIVKFNKCDMRQYKLLTGCVRSSVMYPQKKKKMTLFLTSAAQKYDAFLVSKPVLGKFNAYFGYALAGAGKAPPFGLSVEQPVMAGVEEAKNTARIRRKRNELVVIVGHVTMLPEHLTQNVNRVVTHLTRMLTENPDVAVRSVCIKSRSGPKLKLC